MPVSEYHDCKRLSAIAESLAAPWSVFDGTVYDMCAPMTHMAAA